MTNLEIIITEDRMPAAPATDMFNRVGELCIAESGLSAESLELSVTFVSLDEIREINRQYRSKDDITDVISFPQYSSLDEIPEDHHISLGDVVICTEQAMLQADDFGHSQERELAYLFAHGVLHLLAYDHESEDDRNIMRTVEERIMSELNLSREMD